MKKEILGNARTSISMLRVQGKRLMAVVLSAILLFAVFPITVYGNTQQQTQLHNMLRNSDFEMLFGHYTAFTNTWLDNVGPATVVGHALSGGLSDAVRRGVTFLTAGFSGLEQEVMNNPNRVNQLVRDIISEMFGNGPTISTTNFTSTVGIAAKIVDLVGGDINLQVSLELIQYTTGAGSAIDRAMHEYVTNIAMLEALRDLHSAQLWRDTIDGVITEYQRSILSSLQLFAENSLRNRLIDGTVAIVAKPVVLVASVFDVALRNVSSVTALQTMMTSNDINLLAIQAFQNAARQITSGNFTNDDVVSYRAAFYLARGIQIVRYEAKRAAFSRNSNENLYIDAQLASLRYMSYDSFVYSIPFATWAFGRPATMTPTTYVVVDTPAIMRQSFYETSREIRRLPLGTEVTIVETVVNRHGNRWFFIAAIPGVRGGGWIFSARLSRALPQTSSATTTAPTATPTPTPTPRPQQPAQQRLTVTNTEQGQWTINVPANHATVNLYRNAADASSFTMFSTNAQARVINADRIVTLSNGTRRARLTNVTHQGNSMILYMPLTSRIDVVDRTPAPTPTAPTATIRYNANGGTGAPSSHTVRIDSQGVARFNLTTTRPTRTGYTFIGWRLDNDTVFGIDNPGQSIAIDTGSATQSTTFTYFAQWQRNEQATQPTISITNLNIDFVRDVASFTVNVVVHQPSTEVIISVRCANTNIVLAGFVSEGASGARTVSHTFTLLPGMEYRVRGVAIINGERQYTDALIVDAR